MGRRRRKPSYYQGGGQGGYGFGAAGWQNRVEESIQPSRDVYRLNEQIGGESRYIEFKEGHGFIHNNFRAGVAKYICGFLNSGGNGTLMLGINDSGVVCGVDVNGNAEQDSITLNIDEAIKDIQPTVFPRDYSVKFIPIIDDFGRAQGSRKVIEISINKNDAADSDDLFETKQGVYVRRDASLEGPLSAQKIKQWYKGRGLKQFNEEKEKWKKDEQNLRMELKVKQSEYDRKMEEMRQREEEFRIRQEELNKKETELQFQKAEQELRGEQGLGGEQESPSHRGLADKVRELQEENNVLRKQQTESSDKTHQELTEIKQLLAEQAQAQAQAPKKENKSKVCVIS